MFFLSMYSLIVLTMRYVHSVTGGQSELNEASVTNTRTPYHHGTFLNDIDTIILTKIILLVKKTNVVNCLTKITIGLWQYQIICPRYLS